jgi:hypothetical protein
MTRVKVLKAAIHQVIRQPFIQVVIESGSIHKGVVTRAEDDYNLEAIFQTRELVEYKSEQLQNLPTGVQTWILEPVEFDIELLQGRTLISED